MAKARVAVLISGRGSNMAALIYAARAADCPYEVVVVSGDKADAAGLKLAAAEGVPTLPLDQRRLGADFWPTLERRLAEAGVDIVALAGFMRIIPAEVVERWAGRMVNIHPSLLPKYPGLGPHAAALANGDARTGATVHLVTPKVDSGEILGQVEVAIVPGDTVETLAERVLIAEHQLYPRVLADFVLADRRGSGRIKGELGAQPVGVGQEQGQRGTELL